MTVSRTLAGGANVRPDVQAKVLAAVRALGYFRNENARSLRPGQTSGLIGVAITNLGNPYYGNFALGVEEVAAEYGRRILLGNTGEDPDRERQLVADFLGRQVEGLILVPAAEDTGHLRPERLGAVPLVLASRRAEGVAADTVLLDDVGGSARAVTALIEAGHTRVGFLGNNRSVFTGERRHQGYRDALATAGLPHDPALVHRDQQDPESAIAATRALLDLADPPTAVFCANNRNSIGALREFGRRIQEGTPASTLPHLTGFDDFELAELMPVPVTVVDHDARELGRQAARLLLERLDGEAPPAEPRTVEMPVRLVLRRPV